VSCINRLHAKFALTEKTFNHREVDVYNNQYRSDGREWQIYSPLRRTKYSLKLWENIFAVPFHLVHYYIFYLYGLLGERSIEATLRYKDAITQWSNITIDCLTSSYDSYPHIKPVHAFTWVKIVDIKCGTESHVAQCN